MPYRYGHLSAQTRAYARVGGYFFEAVVGSDGRDDSSEHAYGYKPIWLVVGKAGERKPNWIPLTSMTGEELEAMKKVINHALDDALVIATDLDLKAIDLLNEGATEVPFRALASAPPYFERTIPLEYVRPVVEEEPSELMDED